MIQFNTTVKEVLERFRSEHLRGSGKDAEFERVSIGWWILFKDDFSVWVGETKPQFAKGDKVTISIEKA
jgi:hypothetical protein